jgi:hypothetical protein
MKLEKLPPLIRSETCKKTGTVNLACQQSSEFFTSAHMRDNTNRPMDRKRDTLNLRLFVAPKCAPTIVGAFSIGGAR